MSTFAIGDLQGCYDELMDLLNEVNFDSAKDMLWFTGDLVNRGPQSLRCLRFVKSLGAQAITVLGNHDLHLLAIIYGIRKRSPKDTLDDILDAPDLDELTQWLRQQPLIHTDEQLGFTLAHAGVYPLWTLETAHTLADEIQQLLPDDAFIDFLPYMYGNEPAAWHDVSSDNERWRFVINAFTRMRYCQSDGSLEFSSNGPPATASDTLMPWYQVPNRVSLATTVVFGHWSSHPGIAPACIIPTDRGCVWGGPQTAYHLEDGFTYTSDRNQN